MKILVFGCALAVMVAFAAGIVHAATLDDAKAIAEKAAEFWKANGKEKALAEFNNPKGQFVKGDVYVVVLDFKGIVLAHGGNPKLVGANLFDQKDPNSGKFFVREMADVAKTKGSGWVEYSWANPVTKKVQPKKSWVIRIGHEDYLVNCGVFQLESSL
jgi:signal transduction histidine kinase